MTRSKTGTWCLLGAFLVGGVGSFVGCGDSSKTDKIQESPEAINADKAAQDAMQDFMQGKSAKKATKK